MEGELAKGVGGLWEYGGLVTVLVLVESVSLFAIWVLYSRNQGLIDRMFTITKDGIDAMNAFTNQMKETMKNDQGS